MKGMSQIIRSAEMIIHKPWANIRPTPHPGELLNSDIFEVRDVSIQNHFVCIPFMFNSDVIYDTNYHFV